MRHKAKKSLKEKKRHSLKQSALLTLEPDELDAHVKRMNPNQLKDFVAEMAQVVALGIRK